MTTLEKRHLYSELVKAKMELYRAWAKNALSQGLTIEEIADLMHHKVDYISKLVEKEVDDD